MRTRVASRPWPLWAAAASCLAISAGCTMCPDPFDYSGPVPNGTPPQNDFRARSNGILPLGAAPRPWPTVVENAAPTDAEPVGEDASVETAAGSASPVAEVSVMRQTGGGQPKQLQGQISAAPADDILPPDLQPVPPAVELPAGCLPATDMRAPGRVVAPPPAGETPGWRARG